MSKFAKIAAFFLLFIGVLFAFFAMYSLSKGKNKIPDVVDVVKAGKESKTYHFVAAAKDLPAGHYLTAEDLMMSEKKETLPTGFSKIDQLVNRTLLVNINANQIISKEDLIEGVAGLLAEGERAVSIKVDEASAVGHKLQPGDWVDVFVVLKRDGQELDAAQARMLLPRIKVIAYGSAVYGAQASGDTQSKEAAKTTAKTAVLAVKVQEVNRLLLAEQQGQVQLALRNPLDQNEPSADMLKQIPGLSVRKTLNQDVSDATAAINDSLAAIKFGDLAKDVGHLVINKVVEKPAQSTKQMTPMSRGAGGVSVEVIKGSRKETMRY